MSRLPKVVVSSVIRSSHQGESHGGVYLVDLERSTCEQVIDWNSEDIDWAGRGGDRGLRGIAFYGGAIYMAASDEIFVYTREFKKVCSYRNKYLKYCHEISIHGDTLFATSTAFDSILEFDLQRKAFSSGYCVRFGSHVVLLNRLVRKVRYLHKGTLAPVPSLSIFDPASKHGPSPGDTIHLNSVYVSEGKLCFAGTRVNSIFSLGENGIRRCARIVYGSHNARLLGDGVLLNHTSAGHVVYMDRKGRTIDSFAIKRFPVGELLMAHLPKDHAEQAFGRGLCVTTDGLIIGGSSPATVSVYEWGRSTAIKTVTLTMDVRNAIHGLEIWPF